MKRRINDGRDPSAGKLRARRPGRLKIRGQAGHGALALLAALFLLSGGIRISSLGPYLEAGLHAFAASEAESAALAQPEVQQTEPRALLDALTAREAQLRKRDEELSVRERALALAEERIEANLEALVEAERKLRDTIALADGAAADDIERLTRMYETMKPGNAAALFETMDPTFAAGFLGEMRPEAASAILAGLAPETAYMISLVLAGRNIRIPAN